MKAVWGTRTRNHDGDLIAAVVFEDGSYKLGPDRHSWRPKRKEPKNKSLILDAQRAVQWGLLDPSRVPVQEWDLELGVPVAPFEDITETLERVRTHLYWGYNLPAGRVLDRWESDHDEACCCGSCPVDLYYREEQDYADTWTTHLLPPEWYVQDKGFPDRTRFRVQSPCGRYLWDCQFTSSASSGRAEVTKLAIWGAPQWLIEKVAELEKEDAARRNSYWEQHEEKEKNFVLARLKAAGIL